MASKMHRMDAQVRGIDRETLAFTVPLVGQIVGSIVLLIGLFQGGLTALTVLGGGIILASIAGLAASVVASEPTDEHSRSDRRSVVTLGRAAIRQRLQR
ncbi:hypothetical protein OB905_03675 [Halobacteria archaeon AArc-dxtr1]|nr:hypothetical protein [Halobacteria archaeon AArc-dxtr1]